VAVLTTSTCAPGQVTPEPTCPKPAPEGTPPTPAQLAALAGRYELVLVNSNGDYGDSLVHGTLTLWPNDSARRYMPRTIGRLPGERPLAGTFESRSSTVRSYPDRQSSGSRDEPAVEMVEATIYLGGAESGDAGGDRLGVQALTPTGFAGMWTYSRGFAVTVDSATGRVMQEPSGYYCARRAPPA
jgi:hypothetical protein